MKLSNVRTYVHSYDICCLKRNGYVAKIHLAEFFPGYGRWSDDSGPNDSGFRSGHVHFSIFFFISTGSYIYIKIRTIGEYKNKYRAFLLSVIIRKIIFHVFVDVMNFQDSIKLFLKSRACKIFIIIDTSYLPCNTFILTYFTISTCTVIIYLT